MNTTEFTGSTDGPWSGRLTTARVWDKNITDGEKLFLYPYILLALGVSSFLNGSLLRTILQKESLREKALYTILCYQMICDFITPFLYGPVAIFFMLDEGGSLDGMLASLVAACRGLYTLLPLHILSLLAVERYIYICRPLHYETYFSQSRVRKYLVVIAVTLVVATSWSAAVFQTAQSSQLLTSYFQINRDDRVLTALYAVVYGVAPMLVQGFCGVSIAMTAIRQTQRIQEMGLQAMAGLPQNTIPHHMTRKTIVTAIAGVVRLGGLYWVTFVPGTILVSEMRLAFLRKDAQDVETWILSAVRYFYLVMGTAVPVLNPLICIRNITEVRQEWLKVIGKRSSATFPGSSA